MEDLNDNRPVFNPDRYTTSISSHAQPGTEILNVIASDRDLGAFGRVSYELLPGDLSSMFSVEQTSGRLSGWTYPSTPHILRMCLVHPKSL